MYRTRILVLVVCLAAFLLGGCVVNVGMDDKSADHVACKVVEKLKAEHCCPKTMAATAAEPNKPCK